MLLGGHRYLEFRKAGDDARIRSDVQGVTSGLVGGEFGDRRGGAKSPIPELGADDHAFARIGAAATGGTVMTFDQWLEAMGLKVADLNNRQKSKLEAKFKREQPDTAATAAKEHGAVSTTEDAISRLAGRELDQVVFVRDYIQFGFSGTWLNAITDPFLDCEGIRYRRGDPTYCEGLVSLINATVKFASVDTREVTVEFCNGWRIVVSLRDEDLPGGPEAAQIWDEHGRCLILP